MPTLTHTNSGFVLVGTSLVPDGFKREFGKTITRSPIRAKPFYDIADEATRRVLDSADVTREASRALAATTNVKLAPDGLTFFDYQVAGIQFMARHKKCLMADEPGTGKTPMTAGLINAVRPERVLILCPASLQINWRQEMGRWLFWHPTSLEIVSYDSAWRKDNANRLTSANYDLVVMDEAHYCKNADSKRSKLAQVIASRAHRVALLTGTPMDNRPKDLYVLLRMLLPQMFHDYVEFGQRYCGGFLQELRLRSGVKRVWNFDGSSNEAELQDILRSTVMIRRLKKDVLPQLPNKTRQCIIVPADKVKSVKEEAKKWKAVCDEIGYDTAVKQLEDGAGFAFEEMAKVRQEVALAKVPFVVEHIENIAASQKVIVFAHHKSVVEALMTELSELNPVKVVGGMTPKEKDKSVKAFQTDDSVRVFVGNITAAGVGLTLTASSTVVFAELPFRPSDATQGEDRACRIGATSDKVLVQHILLDGSLDVHLAQMLIKKQTVCDKVLDNL